MYETNANDNELHVKKYQETLNERKYEVMVFTMEERELIACAFKNQLGDVRKALKDI